MASATASTLFRQDVLRRQDEAAFGETIRIVPLSHTLLAACLVAIIAVAIVYAAFAGYSRKETVQGLVTPSRGVIRIVAPRAGMISELLVAEGDSVSEDQVLFRVISEETNAAGTGSDTAILEAIKQQKAILEDQIRNEEEPIGSHSPPCPSREQSVRSARAIGGRARA
jgi:membrane fusion protein